jgi:hypothetical protein
MKPLFIALAMVFSLFTKAGFAADEKVSPIVLKSFQQAFSTAKEVDWSISENFYKAQFVLNDQHVSAYYFPDGSMAALTRNITVTQLPVALQAGLKKEYEKYWVSELFEITADNTTQYYVTLENGNEKVILKSASTINWSKFQKSRKV